ncbi:MYXO-CTERM sorting domain-containing protein [Tabrizicola sp.]
MGAEFQCGCRSGPTERSGFGWVASGMALLLLHRKIGRRSQGEQVRRA